MPEPGNQEYRPGSADDFDRLYEASYQRLFGTLIALLRNRAAVEDCVQETFLRAFRPASTSAWRGRVSRVPGGPTAFL